MNKKPLLAGAVALLAAGALATWYFSRPPADAHQLVLYGNVDLRQVSLAFNGSARIARLAVQEGDRVTAGQVLGELDTRTLQLQAGWHRLFRPASSSWIKADVTLGGRVRAGDLEVRQTVSAGGTSSSVGHDDLTRGEIFGDAALKDLIPADQPTALGVQHLLDDLMAARRDRYGIAEVDLRLAVMIVDGDGGKAAQHIQLRDGLRRLLDAGGFSRDKLPQRHKQVIFQRHNAVLRR